MTDLNLQSIYFLYCHYFPSAGLSLLWVFILGLVFLYIYALIAFALFRDLHDEGLGMHCTAMYECFINLVHKGMILSTLEVRIIAHGWLGDCNASSSCGIIFEKYASPSNPQ